MFIFNIKFVFSRELSRAFMHLEETAKSMTWLIPTFRLPTAASAGIPVFSEDQ
jgi:hypothetical protein